jgi:hypothetical protein
MVFLIVKAGLSGLIVVIVSEVARRYPGWGGLIASLPLISLLGMIWLFGATRDPVRLASHSEATFWFVLPSLPMFLLIPRMLRHGWSFWWALAAGCLLTMLLYAGMVWAAPRLGLRL